MAKRKPNTQPVWRFLFLVYMGLMLWLLFGRGRGWDPDADYLQAMKESINLRPFYTIRNYLNIGLHYPNASIFPHCMINLVGNVVMFVPLGLLTPCIWGKLRKFGWHFLYMVLVIVSVEVLQLITLLGSCDVDDLLLNLVGTSVGFLVWKIGERFRRKKQ